MKKQYIIVIISILVTVGLQGQQQPRPMVWCGGAPATSDGWSITFVKGDFEASGYQFEDLTRTDLYGDALSQGVTELGNYLVSELDGEQNVLGIAHDLGGLGLRYAQSLDNRISAMILDGVPNQGSRALETSVFSPVPGSLSKMQAIVEDIKAIQGTDNCNEFCDVVSNFESWINELQGGKSVYRDAYPNSSFIEDVLEEEPSVPYIVLYGELPSFSITRILDSRGSLSNSDALADCYRDAIRRARGEVTWQTNQVVKQTTSVFDGVLGFLGKSVKDITRGEVTFNPVGKIIEAAGSFLKERKERQIERIIALREQNTELSRILRCELSNRLLESEWLLAMLDGQIEAREEEIICDEEYEDCVLECETDVAWGDGPRNGESCEEFCSGHLDPDCVNEIIMVDYFVVEPTDGLLSVTEQKLPGSNLVAEIRLPDTDHIEESQRTNAFMMQTLTDIFNGAHGAEFEVPNN